MIVNRQGIIFRPRHIYMPAPGWGMNLHTCSTYTD